MADSIFDAVGGFVGDFVGLADGESVGSLEGRLVGDLVGRSVAQRSAVHLGPSSSEKLEQEVETLLKPAAASLA